MESSKNRLNEDKYIGERNVATIKATRNRFFNNIFKAMDREETFKADNRNSLANRFRGVKDMFRKASLRDAKRRKGK